ncbi:MAG: MazG nucleotide pyrophosphohydrolase domain-containing protein [Acholeplasmataceae bacterium]
MALTNFDDYQAQAAETAIYPASARLVYPALGLCGEVGELSAALAAGAPDDITQAECGDVLWYVAAVCRDANLSMQDIADNATTDLRTTAAVGAGLVAEGVKKWLRDFGCEMVEGHLPQKIANRVMPGLVMTMSALRQIGAVWGLDLLEVAEANLNKLRSRQERGVLQGDGDQR